MEGTNHRHQREKNPGASFCLGERAAARPLEALEVEYVTT